ncbi:hypothetical protein NUW58_g7053 [Xylaria curta]|uniref:Uncharacterized protein n=1 Tax=Xylaria curta TaxID=42375 RepID=A0ACC1NNN9_9PEZI|nr:hypothetical protein NUW58_g7053 [Xylaria curta]
MSWRRSAQLARGALTRRTGRVPYSTTAEVPEHKEHRATFLGFEYMSPLTVPRPRALEADENLHSPPIAPPRVSWFKANRKLAKTLELSRKTNEEIEAALARLINHPHTTSDDCSETVRLADAWIPAVGRWTYKLVFSRRQYLELKATELLLEALWRVPYIPHRERITLNILNFRRPKKEEVVGWPGGRQLLVHYIAVTKRHISAFTTPEQIKKKWTRQPLPDSPAFFKACLNRALLLVEVIDRLFIAVCLIGAQRNLMRVVDEIVPIVTRLELIDERVWLTSHLENSQSYILDLDAAVSEVTQRGFMPAGSALASDLLN